MDPALDSLNYRIPIICHVRARKSLYDAGFSSRLSSSSCISQFILFFLWSLLATLFNPHCIKLLHHYTPAASCSSFRLYARGTNSGARTNKCTTRQLKRIKVNMAFNRTLTNHNRYAKYILCGRKTYNPIHILLMIKYRCSLCTRTLEPFKTSSVTSYHLNITEKFCSQIFWTSVKYNSTKAITRRYDRAASHVIFFSMRWQVQFVERIRFTTPFTLLNCISYLMVVKNVPGTACE